MQTGQLEEHLRILDQVHLAKEYSEILTALFVSMQFRHGSFPHTGLPRYWSHRQSFLT